jgi:hypothetical protein
VSVRSSAPWCASAVLLIALLSACGGDAEPAKEKADPGPESTAAEKTGPLTITTPAEKFCDKIDLAAVGQLFGSKPSILWDAKAGEKDPNPGAQKPISDKTYCDIRTGTGTQGLVYLAVFDSKSGAEQIKSFDTFAKQTRKQYEDTYAAAGGKCKDLEIEGFGEPTAGVQCGSSKPGAFVSITFAGVFEDAYVTCGYSDLPQETPEKELDSLVEPTRTFCLDTAKAIAN